MAMAWGFLQERFEDIWGLVKKASPSLMGAVIKFICGGFASEARAGEIEAFFKEHPLPAHTRTIDQVLENIRSNATFLQRIKDSAGFVAALEV